MELAQVLPRLYLMLTVVGLAASLFLSAQSVLHCSQWCVSCRVVRGE